MNQAAGISMPTEANATKHDWEEVLLDSVAKRGSGHTPDKKHPEYWGGPIKWISLQDSAQLDALYIEDTAATITVEGIKNSSAVLHQKGTVVLSRDAGVGKSAIMAADMAVSQHFMAWTCGQRLDNHFLYYWLQSKKPEFERIANGNTIKTIGLPYFKDLYIPLPPPEEQKRIASAMSDIDTLISSLDQLIVKKRDIQQAAMQQLLTGQRRLPGFTTPWIKLSLGNIASLYQPETISQSQFFEDGYPVFGANGLIGFFNKFNHENPQITISCRGNCGTVNRTPSRSWITGNAMVVNIDEQRNIDFEFLYQLLKSKDFSSIVSGSGQPQIVRGPLSKFELTLPDSLDEQATIAAILSDMDTELAVIEARRNKAFQLKQGMMQELLTGKIRLHAN